MRLFICILIVCNAYCLMAQRSVCGWYDYYVPTKNWDKAEEDNDSAVVNVVSSTTMRMSMRLKRSGKVICIMEYLNDMVVTGEWFMRGDSLVIQYPPLFEGDEVAEEVYAINENGSNLFLRDSPIIYTKRRRE